MDRITVVLGAQAVTVKKSIDLSETNIVINKEKLFSNMSKIRLKTMGVVLVVMAISYAIGMLFNSLNDIGYLLTISNVAVLATYITYKIFRCIQYNKVFDKKYPLKLTTLVNTLYIFVVVMFASVFLLFTVYSGSVFIVITILYVLITLISVFIYIFIYNNATRIEIPSIFRLMINGLFIGVLFYTLTLENPLLMEE